VLHKFLADRLTLEPASGDGAHRAKVQGDQGVWTLVATERADVHQVVFWSVLPARVAEERRLAMAELITRINAGMHIGCFELDFDDGEVRFRTSAPMPVWNDATAEQLLWLNIEMTDRYFLAILEIAYSTATAEEALALSEG